MKKSFLMLGILGSVCAINAFAARSSSQGVITSYQCPDGCHPKISVLDDGSSLARCVPNDIDNVDQWKVCDAAKPTKTGVTLPNKRTKTTRIDDTGVPTQIQKESDQISARVAKIVRPPRAESDFGTSVPTVWACPDEGCKPVTIVLPGGGQTSTVCKNSAGQICEHNPIEVPASATVNTDVDTELNDISAIQTTRAKQKSETARVAKRVNQSVYASSVSALSSQDTDCVYYSCPQGCVFDTEESTADTVWCKCSGDTYVKGNCTDR